MGVQLPPMQHASCPAFSIVARINLRHQLFVEAWISTNGNGTESARRAGYKGSENVLASYASQLLRNPKVKALLDKRTEKALAKVHKGTSPEAVIAKLAAQMNGEEPAKWRDGDKEYNSQGAAALLGKFLGLEKPNEPPGQVTLIQVQQFFDGLSAQAVEEIRAATLKTLPGTVEA